MTQDGPDLADALFESSPDAIVVVDRAGVIQMASPAVLSLFGWQSAELIGQPVEALIPEELASRHVAHRNAFTVHPVARPMGSGLSLLGRRYDGSTFPIDVSLAPIPVQGHPCVAAFVRDATERRRGEDLQRFIGEISQLLLRDRAGTEALALVARRGRQLGGAPLSWVIIPSESNRLMVAAADGDHAKELLGATLEAETSFSAEVMTKVSRLAVEDMSSEPRVLEGARQLGLGPGLYVPIVAESGPIGVLVLARPQGVPPFSESETNAVDTYATASAVALSLALAREELQQLQVVSEHERIARDLHDTVIQRLFALGMSLQGTQQRATGAVAERLDSAVDTIDQVIRQIRETIFDLSRPPPVGSDIRRQLRQVAAEASAQLGYAPRLTLRGPVDTVVTDDLARPLVAVAREALSNAGRHAKASQAELTLEAGDGWVLLRVLDDGIGIPDNPPAGHGLDNMATRARQLGGDLTLLRRQPSGTVVEWRVPSASGKQRETSRS